MPAIKKTLKTRPKEPLPARLAARVQRTEELRNRIFAAAAKIVGDHGYADASIDRITELAGMAKGTFYLYFSSRQDLLDELLPHVGTDLITYLRAEVSGAKTFFEVEERGFRAFFSFLKNNPGFFRILNEAEVAAPVAHAKHMALVTAHYVSSMQRSVERGEIKNFRDKELEALAYVFQSARSYLYMRYVKDRRLRKPPEWVVEAYMKLIRGGFN